jgi:hypothetical protein
MKLRNHDPSVVAALAANVLGAGQGIDSPEASLERQGAVNPTRLQLRIVRETEVRPNDPTGGWSSRLCDQVATDKWAMFERILGFSSRGREVYASVERIQFSALERHGSRANAGHCFWG